MDWKFQIKVCSTNGYCPVHDDRTILLLNWFSVKRHMESWNAKFTLVLGIPMLYQQGINIVTSFKINKEYVTSERRKEREN